MGKFEINRQKIARRRPWLLAVLILLILVLVFLLWVETLFEKNALPELNQNKPAASSIDTSGESTVPTEPQDAILGTDFAPIELGDGLRITDVGSYAGIYMEDGTDETVSDVMMLVLENTSEEDLQLARIQLDYTGFMAEFEVTNLPAGESAVLLERNRHAAVTGDFKSVEAVNVVFFETPMGLQGDRLSVTGGNGSIAVTNVTGGDITGDIMIYYKNNVNDLFYGGITYRVRITGGIAAGETARVMAGHFTQDQSRVVWITCGD